MRWDRDTGPRYVAINNEVINIHVVTTALHKMNKKLYFSPLRTPFSHLSALALYPVPGAAIVLGGSGGECDPSGEVATLLVLVIALLSRNCGEPRTSPTPSKQNFVRTDNTSCLPPDLVVALQSWMCPMPPVASLLSQ